MTADLTAIIKIASNSTLCDARIDLHDRVAWTINNLGCYDSIEFSGCGQAFREFVAEAPGGFDGPLADVCRDLPDELYLAHWQRLRSAVTQEAATIRALRTLGRANAAAQAHDAVAGWLDVVRGLKEQPTTVVPSREVLRTLLEGTTLADAVAATGPFYAFAAANGQTPNVSFVDRMNAVSANLDGGLEAVPLEEAMAVLRKLKMRGLRVRPVLRFDSDDGNDSDDLYSIAFAAQEVLESWMPEWSGDLPCLSLPADVAALPAPMRIFVALWPKMPYPASAPLNRAVRSGARTTAPLAAIEALLITVHETLAGAAMPIGQPAAGQSGIEEASIAIRDLCDSAWSDVMYADFEALGAVAVGPNAWTIEHGGKSWFVYRYDDSGRGASFDDPVIEGTVIVSSHAVSRNIAIDTNPDAGAAAVLDALIGPAKRRRVA